MNISTALHLCEFEIYWKSKINKPRKETYDTLFKLTPFTDGLQFARKVYFVPGRNIYTDERMVAFKGQTGMNSK